jgi:hypothetical protein
MKKLILLSLITVGATIPLQAKNVCAPAAGKKWVPMASARKAAVAAGYTNIRMGIEAGCYEAEAKKNGVDYEIYIDPVTGKIVKVRKDID